MLLWVSCLCMCRVSHRVVEFYKALAAKEVPSVGKFWFPDMVFEIPPEEVMANARRKVDGRLVNGRMSMPSRAENLFERCPPEIILETEKLFDRCPAEVLPESRNLFPEVLPDTEKLSGRCPREILPETIVCYHCKKEGHPAFKCKLGPLLIINA